jgi:hypothetical protein
MRVLDELANAFQAARENRLPRPILSSVRLEDQLGPFLRPVGWNAVQRYLGCLLPPLEFDQGHWWLPAGLVTIWDLAEYVARSRPEWEPPLVTSPAAWLEAQVFAGVRDVLAYAGNIDPEEISRPARLGADLGLE